MWEMGKEMKMKALWKALVEWLDSNLGSAPMSYHLELMGVKA